MARALKCFTLTVALSLVPFLSACGPATISTPTAISTVEPTLDNTATAEAAQAMKAELDTQEANVGREQETLAQLDQQLTRLSDDLTELTVHLDAIKDAGTDEDFRKAIETGANLIEEFDLAYAKADALIEEIESLDMLSDKGRLALEQARITQTESLEQRDDLAGRLETLTDDWAVVRPAREAFTAVRPYPMTFSVENGRVVARSPMDAGDDSHYEYQDGEWVDRHPGRNAIEDAIFPSAAGERTIWLELQGFIWDETTGSYQTDDKNEPAVWDQEAFAYRYPSGEYYQPAMGLEEHGGYGYREADIEHGRTVLTDLEIESPDFQEGVSGIKVNFFLSSEHPYVANMRMNPEIEEELNELLANMFLSEFPQLVGRSITYRIPSEDFSSLSDIRAGYRENVYGEIGGENTTIIGNKQVGTMIDIDEQHSLVSNSFSMAAFITERELPSGYRENWYTEEIIISLLNILGTYSGRNIDNGALVNIYTDVVEELKQEISESHPEIYLYGADLK